MIQRARQRLTYANVAATLALFLVLSGGTAVALSGRNSVQSDDISRGAVKQSDLGKREVTGSKIATNAITGSKIAPGAVGTSDTGPVPAGRLLANGQEVPSGQIATVNMTDAQFAIGVTPAANGFTIQTPGIYAVGGQVDWANENGKGSRGLDIAIQRSDGGFTVVPDGDTRSAAEAGSDTEQTVYTLENLDAGDHISLQVGQDSGATLLIPGSGETHLTLNWVGPCAGAC